MFLHLGKKKKKKKKKINELNGAVDPTADDTTEPEKSKPETIENNITATINPDPAKRLRNLKKKLREIETIEANILIKKPDKDQLEKIARKSEVLSEILALELSLQI